jgi:glycosyltransferase involved in cell wall biosynthesis
LLQLTILSKLNPYFGNSAQANRLASLINGLKENEIVITILITGGYQTTEEKKKLGVRGAFNQLNYHYLSTYISGNLWKRRWYKYIGSRFSLFFLRPKLLKEIEQLEGIVWAPLELNELEVVLKAKERKPKLKLFMEISEFPDYYRYQKLNSLQFKKAEKLEFLFLKKMLFQLSGLALMTEALMRSYNENFGNKVKRIHLPMTVDLARFTNTYLPIEGLDSSYLVYVGVMNDAKDGVNILIEAFSLISNQFPEIKLMLVGPWQYDTPNHLRMIQDFGLSDRIFWKGEMKRELIPSVLFHAKLLLLPRPDSRQAQGGFPTKLGEYLATGRPVCATRVGEIPNYLTDNDSVFFATPGSVSSFAEAMQRALSNDEFANQVGKNGKQIALKSFNNSIQGNILYNFLKSL